MRCSKEVQINNINMKLRQRKNDKTRGLETQGQDQGLHVEGIQTLIVSPLKTSIEGEWTVSMAVAL